jgi:putative FmdB family regulatory protein
MPTYEYQCNACDHRFEELQSFSEPPLKKCPACKKKKLQRLLGTGAAIIFKGSGFYQTDYRSDSYKSAAEADKPPAPTTEKTGTDAAKAASDTKDTKGTAKADPGKSAGKKAKP